MESTRTSKKKHWRGIGGKLQILRGHDDMLSCNVDKWGWSRFFLHNGALVLQRGPDDLVAESEGAQRDTDLEFRFSDGRAWQCSRLKTSAPVNRDFILQNMPL